MAAGLAINGKAYRIEEYMILLILVTGIYALVYLATK